MGNTSKSSWRSAHVQRFHALLLLPLQVLSSFEGTDKGELVMDVELMDAFDDEADQGYYEDEAVTVEQLEQIVADSARFTGGTPFEKLPGQLPSPLESGVVKPSKDGGLPGQLGQDIGGSSPETP